MASEAWVLCRYRPALPATGELDDGKIHYSVRPLDADGERALRRVAPEVRPGELRWLVAFAMAGDWYDSFEAGGAALARRCGGGVLWSPLWGERVPALMVSARPDPGRWTLVEALEHAFWHQTDMDEREWQAEQDELEGRAPRDPAPAAARAPARPTPIGPATSARAPGRTVGESPRIIHAVRAAGRSTWATSCLVWQSGAGDGAAVFSGIGGREAVAELTARVARELSDPSMLSASERVKWPIQQSHAIALAQNSAAPSAPVNASMAAIAWGESQVFIAHVGAARVYRLRPSQGQFELLTQDDVLGATPPADNIVTNAVGLANGFQIHTRELVWFPDDVLILCSVSVWRNLGDEGIRAMVTELREAAAAAMIERVAELAPDSGAAVALAFERGRDDDMATPIADAPGPARPPAARQGPDARPADSMPVTVDANALFADPTRWHGRRVDVVACWHYAFEHSSVGSAWLEAPEHTPVSYGTYRVRIVGTWIYPAADAGGGYGHLGASPGVLRAESIDVLEILDQPQASRDGLTGLPKRTALGVALDQAVRTQQPVALALLNIDRFKRLNDAHGHAAGDELLRRCAAALVEALRPGDVVVRWGGDAFGAVMPGATIDAARELLEGVHARVRTLGVTVSAGLVAAGPGDTSAAIFERVDQALYEAKRRGRNCTVAVGDGAR